MNNSFVRLIDGMCATLRNEVLPRLDDEFARGQVFGVINLLNTFRVRADWSAGFLAQQVNAQSQALNAAGIELANVAQAPAALQRPTVEPVGAAELLRLRDEGNRAIGELLGWLAGHRGTLPPEKVAEVERLLRGALRTEIELELKHSPRPLFAEMSSGREELPPPG
ncbi:MAG TPA: hypothetical protein PKA20_11485 [Burkholderiaceae bacterium]|nr:hypothetical protein [Burkholderiaceae bacterium]